MFLEKDVLKICSKFTGEHPCQSGCSPVNLLHIFRKPLTKNISVWLLLLNTIYYPSFAKTDLKSNGAFDKTLLKLFPLKDFFKHQLMPWKCCMQKLIISTCSSTTLLKKKQFWNNDGLKYLLSRLQEWLILNTK